MKGQAWFRGWGLGRGPGPPRPRASPLWGHPVFLATLVPCPSDALVPPMFPLVLVTPQHAH